MDRTDTGNAVSIALSYVLGYLIISAFMNFENSFCVLSCCAVFTVFILYGARGKRFNPESILWISGVWVCALLFTGILPGRIWGESLLMLMIAPFFGGYAAFTASGGRSGAFFILDCLDTFIGMPFSNLFARFGMLRKSGLAGLNGRGRSIALGCVALFIAFVFFAAALALLRSADTGFQKLTDGIYSQLSFSVDTAVVVRILVSLPVSAYLFGQVYGLNLLDGQKRAAGKQAASELMNEFRRLSVKLWCALLGVFTVMYLLFIGVQGVELVKAMGDNLAPGELTMAEFAKQGFFEMCAVMALNFALIFVAERSSETSLRLTQTGRLSLTGILASGILFSVSACIKLVMYLNAFGFTALRLQGAWGAGVLLFGCAAALRWVWSGKDTSRAAILYTGASLILTLLY